MRYDTPEKKAAHATEERARRAKNPGAMRSRDQERNARRRAWRREYQLKYNQRPDQKTKRKVRDEAFLVKMTPEEREIYLAERREYHRNYRIKNAEDLREKRVNKKYGISFKETFAAQGFKCAIEHENNHLPQHMKGWQVDHCHRSGKTRAILCGRCNAVLGSVNDDAPWLLAIADYVEGFRKLGST